MFLTKIGIFLFFQVKTAIFTHNDGRTSNLLQADGTIPMCYQDVMYNIPITMWLLESYPRNCPLVFVTPTRDMIIKPRHPYVNPSGMVSAPYLQAWVYPRSNLVELVQSLSLLFGNDPPLYSRLPPAPMSSHLPQSTSPFMNPMHTGGQMPPPSMLSSGLHPPVQPTSRPSYPPYQNSQPPPRTDEPSEAYKWSLINTLSDRLHHDTQALMQDRNTEMDRLFNTQVYIFHHNCHFPVHPNQFAQGHLMSVEISFVLVICIAKIYQNWVFRRSHEFFVLIVFSEDSFHSTFRFQFQSFMKSLFSWLSFANR